MFNTLMIDDRATEARAVALLADVPLFELETTDDARGLSFGSRRRRVTRDEPARAQPEPRARYTSRQKRQPARRRAGSRQK